MLGEGDVLLNEVLIDVRVSFNFKGKPKTFTASSDIIFVIK